MKKLETANLKGEKEKERDWGIEGDGDILTNSIMNECRIIITVYGPSLMLKSEFVVSFVSGEVHDKHFLIRFQLNLSIKIVSADKKTTKNRGVFRYFIIQESF